MLLRLAYPGITNVFALLRLLPMSSRDKDAEILALRHQIPVLRRQPGPGRVRFTPGDRALLHRLPRDVLNRLHLVVRPDTVFRWHRNLVARRHARRSRHPGRPRTVRSIRVLAVRLVRDNPGRGYRRVHGELLVPGIKAAASTVWEILHEAGTGPAPEHSSTTWADFLHSQPRLCWPAASSRRSPCPGHGWRARGDRARQPDNHDPGRHCPPGGVLGGAGRQEPRDGPGRYRRPGTVPDQGPGREVPGPVRCHPR
jgi:hypothetical protein